MTMGLQNHLHSEPAKRILACVATATWAAFAAYCLLSLVVGPAGMISCRQLEADRADMQRNLGSLGEANAHLRVELESLRSDADRAAREARSLGYLRPGEGSIVIAGRSAARGEIEPGNVIPFRAPRSCPDSVLKEIALGIFLASLAFGLAPRKNP